MGWGRLDLGLMSLMEIHQKRVQQKENRTKMKKKKEGLSESAKYTELNGLVSIGSWINGNR